MAGTALATGMLGAATMLALGLAGVGAAALTAQRAAGAADAAALAAADAASGAVMVEEAPCALAARVAAASGTIVTDCTIIGYVATVQVQAKYAGLAAISRARAGPPDGK